MMEQATPNDSLTAPGKVLRAARDAAGLSQAEVARKLRLSQQSIKDIEADDYEHFSAVIYVSGYIRNYATLLHLNSKPLLDAFYQMGFAEEVKSLERTNASTLMTGVHRTVMANRSHHNIARWASLGVLCLLVTLVGLWWYGQHHHRHAMPLANVMHSQPAQSSSSSAVHLPLTVHKQSHAHHQ